MSFISFRFWVVFPFIFLLYWAIPARYNNWRKVFLILASYLLYMNWKPAFALVLLLVTAVTYLGGTLIGGQSEARRKRRLALLFTLLGLLPLLVFKYYNFLNDSLSAGLAAVGLKFALPGLNWAVPVGISFFSIQAVGYLLDVYHGRAEAERNFLDYTLFVSFFPQIVAGPISTSRELMPQIRQAHSFDYEQGKQGLKRLLWGMFLKLVVADRLGIYVDTVFGNYAHFNGATNLLASIFYSIQIYCDFAGYSLMAVGIAKTLGFDLIDNFRRPYLATGIRDFWKRWHISLTRWLTQQVYIPLGGNRCPRLRNYGNILITFLVSGLWHGASWTFVVWGALHGLLLIGERAFKLQDDKGTKPAVRILRIGVTFLLVNFAWVFFRMPDLPSALGVFGQIFTDFGTSVDLTNVHVSDLVMYLTGIGILAFKDLRDEFAPGRFAFLNRTAIRWSVYVILSVLTLSIGVLDAGQFIYAEF